ncbi:IS3 family transposase [Staphylococcus pseudintermedius]
MTQILRRHGHTVTQRTVSRLMKELGIRSITKKKYKATAIQSIIFLYTSIY